MATPMGALRLLFLAIAFPFRFQPVRRLATIAILVVGIGLGVAAAIVRLTDAGGAAFTMLFLASFGACVAVTTAAIISLWRLRTRPSRTLEELLALTPGEFEVAVARMLRGRGYREVSVVGGPGDLAADILCRDRQGRSVAVQCKRKTPGQRVGSAEMQKFIGMISVHHEADAGIFVTTSEFTQPAIELAERHGITLLDGEALSRLARKKRLAKPAAASRRAA